MLVCSVQIISRLDSQSKLQMFTLFSGRNVGVLRRYWSLCAKYFDEYLSLGTRTDLKISEVSFLLISYNITIS